MKTFFRSPISRLSLCAFVGSLLVVGCGRHGKPTTVPVEGTVTFGGGPWPTAGRLYFTMKDPSPEKPYRPATALFDANGTLKSVSTFEQGDGLLPGTHRIGVECWKHPPGRLEGPPAESYVPEPYRSPAKSGLTVTVAENQGTVVLSLDVPK